MNTDLKDIIFYGPQPCPECDKMVVTASHEQGGAKYDVPEGPIYPNSIWNLHVCPNAAQSAVPTDTTPEVAPADAS